MDTYFNQKLSINTSNHRHNDQVNLHGIQIMMMFVQMLIYNTKIK